MNASRRSILQCFAAVPFLGKPLPPAPTAEELRFLRIATAAEGKPCEETYDPDSYESKMLWSMYERGWLHSTGEDSEAIYFEPTAYGKHLLAVYGRS